MNASIVGMFFQKPKQRSCKILSPLSVWLLESLKFVARDWVYEQRVDVLVCIRIQLLSGRNDFRHRKRRSCSIRFVMIITLTFEGDELYTLVDKRVQPSDSKGWTAVIMERASRFVGDQRCGKKDEKMFRNVMSTVARYVKQSQDISFLSDGERRYGNRLFDLCPQQLDSDKQDGSAKTLPEGVRVRIKNKGSQNTEPENRRPKYEAPWREHPDTKQTLNNSDIHANHIEAQNAALRRRNSAFRRRTNTYAKSSKGLQRTLDVHQIIHNFVRPHWTTGEVPAVALGVLEKLLCLESILNGRFAQ